MKKSDLKYGNVVEVRNGQKYVIYHSGYEKALVNLLTGWGTDIGFYNENLTYNYGITGFDIMKVYKDYTCKELLWERKEKPKPKAKLTEDEKVILRNIPKEYKWFARDINDCLYIYENKPEKGISIWEASGLPITAFDHLFRFIEWEDEEPYLIEDLLKGEEK